MRRTPRSTSPLHQAGFTLIEIMVVVIVLAILAVTIIPQFVGTANDARVSRARSDIAKIEDALGRFEVHMGRYPTTAEGLRALVEPPADGQGRWQGYLSKLVDDPWGQPYQYRAPGSAPNRAFEIWSQGADGADGGEGMDADITNWDGAR